MLSEETKPRRGSTASPQRILQTLLRRIWTIMLVALVIVGSALGFSLYQTPTYEASAKILVGQESTGDTSLGGDIEGLQQFTLTVAKAAPTVPVSKAVVEQLGLPEGSAEEVRKKMSAEADPGTMFVNVSYQDPDPKRAQQIANTIGQVLSEEISEVSLGANTITAKVWEPATLPESPASPNLTLNIIVALVLGSLLGIVLAFLLEYIDDSWNSTQEVEEVSRVPTFGVIPMFTVSASRKVEILASKEGEQ
jgi:capsular polysaccharide biosynthesis protein